MKYLLALLVLLSPSVAFAQKITPAFCEQPCVELRADIAGVVHLNVRFGKEGNLEKIQVAGGLEALSNLAKENASRWRISPSNEAQNALLTYVFVIDERAESIRMEYDPEQKIVTITQKRPSASP